MSLIETIRNDMLQATKEGGKENLDILKMALASIRNTEISLDKELSDDEVLNVLKKEVKKIKDSIEQYQKMDRQDLLDIEQKQLSVLEKYLPASMPEEELRKIVKAKIEELGVKDMREMGKVMGSIMSEVNGRADGNSVKTIVQEILK